MNLLITFVILSIINVIFATIRVITTVKSDKGVASLISGGYFAFYNIMLIYTVADFPLWQKCIITFVCNVIGVYLVKWFEERKQAKSLWKIDATTTEGNVYKINQLLTGAKAGYNYTTVSNNDVVYNIYCTSKHQKQSITQLLQAYEIKYFVSESNINI